MSKRRYIRGEVQGARLVWLDTGWGCGGVFIRDGRIVGGAAIFGKLGGTRIKDLPRRYRWKKV